MRSKKGSRKIVISNTEYRWRATGDDGYISIGIWPSNNLGPYIQGNFGYHQTWAPIGDNCYSALNDQIVITNRIIRRVIEYAIYKHAYDPLTKGKELNLRVLDDVIKWDDAVRENDIENKNEYL